MTAFIGRREFITVLGGQPNATFSVRSLRMFGAISKRSIKPLFFGANE
jgi:hypothetical protein